MIAPARHARAHARRASSDCRTACARPSARPTSAGTGAAGRASSAARTVPLASRIAQLAEFVEVAHRVGGIDGGRALARRRERQAVRSRASPRSSGRDADDDLRRASTSVGSWSAVIDAEPALAVVLSGERFDAALLAIANFVDLKSPYTLGHSRAVARSRRRGRRGRSGCPRPRCARCGARASCTTSAGSACRTRSGTSPGRSAPASGSACGCTRTSPSACCTSRRAGAARRDRRAAARAPRRLGLPARARRAARSPAPRESSAPPTPTRRCASRGRTAPARSATTRPRSCAPRCAPGGSTREAVDAVLERRRPPRARGGARGRPGSRAREVEVLRLLAHGLSNKEIAAAARDLAEDRGQPHRAHLREDRRVNAARPRACSRCSTGCSRRSSSHEPLGRQLTRRSSRGWAEASSEGLTNPSRQLL